MIKVEETHICDMCGREIQTVTVTSSSIKIIDLGRPKHKVISELFPHTCPECTVKLDKLLYRVDQKQKEREAVMLFNKSLNEARKIKLGTEG